MPGLEGVAGDGFLALGVSEDKAVLGTVLLEPGVGGGALEVGRHVGHIDVQGQTGLML